LIDFESIKRQLLNTTTPDRVVKTKAMMRRNGISNRDQNVLLKMFAPYYRLR
jgi:hypothetical protein